MQAKFNIESVTVPAGDYWVGDPCYGVPGERWMEWLKAADYENAVRFLAADLDGQSVAAVQTAYGDGVFFDDQGREYPVDAGLIGVVPVALVEEDEPFGMHRVTFDTEFKVAYDKGTIHIGPIAVDTDPTDDSEGGW